MKSKTDDIQEREDDACGMTLFFDNDVDIGSKNSAKRGRRRIRQGVTRGTAPYRRLDPHRGETTAAAGKRGEERGEGKRARAGRDGRDRGEERQFRKKLNEIRNDENR